jgi:hypothetical protein
MELSGENGKQRPSYQPRALRSVYNHFEVPAMLLAKPWWVNLLIFVPLISLYFWRRERLAISWKTLIYAGAFAAAFGFVEATTVDYLRGNIPDLQSLQATMPANVDAVHVLPERLLKTETFREAATIIMLIAVPCLAAARARERWALFLWCFAIWDIVYYAGLRVTIGWPTSLRELDVLFLIPQPWFAEVWYPVVVSIATLGAIILRRREVVPRKRLSDEAVSTFVPPARLSESEISVRES